MNICIDLPGIGQTCMGSAFAKFNGSQIEPYHVGVAIFCAALAVVAIQMIRRPSA